MQTKEELKMKKSYVYKTLVSSMAAIFLVPALSFASATIGSVRAGLSGAEQKALYQNENRGKRFTKAPAFKNIDVTIGSVRAGLSKAELAHLIHDENRGKVIVNKIINISDVKIGSVRAGLSDSELLNLKNNENKGKKALILSKDFSSADSEIYVAELSQDEKDLIRKVDSKR